MKKEKQKIYKKLPNKLTVEIYKSVKGGFWSKIKEMPGCYSQGEDLKDLFIMLENAIEIYSGIDLNKKHGR